MSTTRLTMDSAGTSIATVGLADGSVLIGRNTGPSSTSIVRLLPDDRFDPAFGGAAGYQIPFNAVGAMTLDAGGKVIVAGRDATSALLARYRLDTPLTSAIAVEYFNVNLRHYFVTASAAEKATIEAGGAGPGWQRTGNDFRVWLPEVSVPVSAIPVCRFYGTPGRGPNSHFYTANPNECAEVRRDQGWLYEGIAFYVTPPVNDICQGSTAVYRAYNNGFSTNDSNHRYSTQLALLQSMKAQGWSVEGVAFCGALN